MVIDLNKTKIYEFWYDYIKKEYGKKIKWFYTETVSFIIHIKTRDSDQDILKDADKKFDTSNNGEEMLLTTGKNRKVLDMKKNRIGKRIIK